ncbi:hypothetical protein VNI00_014822 [Paramarasmius palmivorus]|uniref:Uncharacterized protein n=1 Tax=Paramarasmius palmivorus TaxID=297713 RepID=A0AAW0BRS1_9AGAR
MIEEKRGMTGVKIRRDTIGRIQPLCQFSGVKTPGMTENDYRIAWYGPQKGSDTHEPQDPRKVEKDPARARLWRFSLAKAIRKRQFDELKLRRRGGSGVETGLDDPDWRRQGFLDWVHPWIQSHAATTPSSSTCHQISWRIAQVMSSHRVVIATAQRSRSNRKGLHRNLKIKISRNQVLERYHPSKIIPRHKVRLSKQATYVLTDTYPVHSWLFYWVIQSYRKTIPPPRLDFDPQRAKSGNTSIIRTMKKSHQIERSQNNVRKRQQPDEPGSGRPKEEVSLTVMRKRKHQLSGCWESRNNRFVWAVHRSFHYLSHLGLLDHGAGHYEVCSSS